MFRNIPVEFLARNVGQAAMEAVFEQISPGQGSKNSDMPFAEDGFVVASSCRERLNEDSDFGQTNPIYPVVPPLSRSS
jgi:hypothetical protein